MKKTLFLIILVFVGLAGGLRAQLNPQYAHMLEGMYRFTVPLMLPEQLQERMDTGQEFILIDARSKKEQEISHIPGAHFVDYDGFNKKDVESYGRDIPVIVYCSVGYRSERVGEKLQRMGFRNVYNLYGGIFQWSNEGRILLDSGGDPTQFVHTYNEDWGRWLLKGTKVN